MDVSKRLLDVSSGWGSGSGDASSGSGEAGSGSGAPHSSGDDTPSSDDPEPEEDDDDWTRWFRGGESNKDGLTRDQKIGIGIGCSVAGLLVVGGIAFFINKAAGDGVRVVKGASSPGGQSLEMNKV